ncbi:MAG: DUF1028 domain-containing protein [Tissierellia bacterium]|nr:DUF1028 domain-containing protein [Tissierellia bacterium]
MKIATFSIVARDPETEEFGIAVQSKFLAVGSRGICWAKAGAGAIVTQAMANFDFGEIGLPILEKGYSAEQVGRALLELDPNKADRQFGIVDAKGGSFTFTGEKCFDYAGGICGENFAAQGNILENEETVKALVETFQNSEGPLAKRLVDCLEAAQSAGGDRRGRQAAALYIAREGASYGGYNDTAVDLRVDDHPEPIQELRRLLELHELYFGQTKEEDRLPLDEEMILKIQEKLKELEYYKGEPNGTWDEETQEAFMGFAGWENYEERVLEGPYIDALVYHALLEK